MEPYLGRIEQGQISRAGNAARPNQSGIFIFGATRNDSRFNQVGASSSETRNVVSGNLLYGIFLSTGIANRVFQNYVGVSSDGTTDIPNGSYQIYLNNAAGCQVGGVSDTVRNFIRFGFSSAFPGF